MTAWRIFKLVVAAGLLWFSLGSGVFAYQLRTLLWQAEKPLLRKPVDFSVKGATYHGVIHHFIPGAHGLTFRIDTPREYESREKARQALNGLELSVKWERMKLKEPIQYVLSEKCAYAFQPGKKGFVPAYVQPSWISESDRYELSIKVLKPCHALEGIPHSLAVCHEMCGLEAMQWRVSLGLAMLLGLAGLALLVSTLYQWWIETASQE